MVWVARRGSEWAMAGSGPGQLTLQDRTHFFAIAARTMRRILIVHCGGLDLYPR